MPDRRARRRSDARRAARSPSPPRQDRDPFKVTYAALLCLREELKENNYTGLDDAIQYAFFGNLKDSQLIKYFEGEEYAERFCDDPDNEEERLKVEEDPRLLFRKMRRCLTARPVEFGPDPQPAQPPGSGDPEKLLKDLRQCVGAFAHAYTRDVDAMRAARLKAFTTLDYLRAGLEGITTRDLIKFFMQRTTHQLKDVSADATALRKDSQIVSSYPSWYTDHRRNMEDVLARQLDKLDHSIASHILDGLTTAVAKLKIKPRDLTAPSKKAADDAVAKLRDEALIRLRALQDNVKHNGLRNLKALFADLPKLTLHLALDDAAWLMRQNVDISADYQRARPREQMDGIWSTVASLERCLDVSHGISLAST
ncbi:hypothetical protein JCM10207_008965 [Rhodosporidiobolus poonsookiae]